MRLAAFSSSRCCRPVVVENTRTSPADLDGASVLRVEAPAELLDERGDLLPPLAQRRNPDLDDVEPVVQVLAELVRAHRALEIAVGRRNQPHVRSMIFSPPKRENSPSWRTWRSFA